jgi:hypothetical protein
MKLTLEQAATRLGKSRRQVLYAIRKGELQAEKLAGRWFIESDDLGAREPQREVVERKRRRLRAAVEDTLDLAPGEGEGRRYSVRDLKAFQVALPIYRETGQALGEEHAASQALRRMLEQLARGCHRFERSEKAQSYGQARDEASLAVCELLLAGSAVGDRLLEQVEQELMPAFAGLMRRNERRRRF